MTELVYAIKPKPSQIKAFKKAWKKVQEAGEDYWETISILEIRLSEETGIPNIEIFHSDGCAVGVGTTDRKMRLVHDTELE